jgi:hypothetical protein
LLGITKIHAERRDFFREGWMKTDVLYALTDEGVKVAVIDVTSPEFAVSATDEELGKMAAQYIREAAQQQDMPAPLREALRNSMLGRGIMGATGTFLDGMSTYLLKLGPENLGERATPIDQRIAASFPAFMARLRLQDMTQLLADGLATIETDALRRKICLVNIGGGPGSDSWNALLLLRARQSDWLADREITIAVMDLDQRGPAFGGRAVEALCATVAPLCGLNIGFRHLPYQWSDSNRLGGLLDELQCGDAACGISSEGGVFEYGSDEEIVLNLRALHGGTAGDAFVVGSVTREGEPVRASLVASRFLTRPRTMEAFRDLSAQAGWNVQEVRDRPFSYNVRLVKA